MTDTIKQLSEGLRNITFWGNMPPDPSTIQLANALSTTIVTPIPHSNPEPPPPPFHGSFEAHCDTVIIHLYS